MAVHTELGCGFLESVYRNYRADLVCFECSVEYRRVVWSVHAVT